ncbi:hypothetical protein [Streptomyces sp. NPDC005209]|uniref:hypothetical protein n=1 Tax=Streptomyces sp. NPDC005209 TaxID=3156715 RepID=UPI0033B7D312
MTIRPDSTLGSHATGSFVTVSGPTSPDQTVAALEQRRFVIVIDGETVASVLTADAVASAAAAGLPTIGAATAPPCVVAAERTTFAEFCDSLSITLLDLGADAIVLLDDRDRVSGVLPASMIQRYLGSGGHTPEPSEMGAHGSTDDHTVHGRPGLPLARVVCREAGCGRVNTLPYYDPTRPPLCQNPSSRHRLRTGT